MTIPPAFLDELRARIPLSDIVGRRVKLQRAGREYKAPCPFHAEKTPSFYINDQKSFFHCFGCGAHGDAVGFLMRHDGLAFPEAVEQLAAQAGMEMPRPEPAERQKYDHRKRLAEALEVAGRWFEAQLQSPAGREALTYLQGRGLDERAIAEFRLGYAPPGSDALRAALVAQGHEEADLEEVGLIRRPEDGRAPYSFFRNRAMFPVSDRRGRVIAFGGRLLEGEGPKYVNSPEHALFHKGSILYGLARAGTAIARGDRPVVVEGYMDVIAMQRAGFGGAVAPLGTALGEAQLAELWKAQRDQAALDYPPILCFDGDNAGHSAARRAIDRILPLLGPGRTVAVAFLPRGDDPDSLVRRGGAAAMQDVLDGALPLVEAIWEFTAAGRMMNTPEQRAALVADLEARAGAIADSSVRSFYRGELRRRFDEHFPLYRPGGRKGPPRPPMVAGSKPQPALNDATIERRILLLATMVHHPFLFDEWAETLAEIELPPGWEPLRQEVLRALGAEALDAQRLGDHLRNSGHGRALDKIASLSAAVATCVAPDAPEDRVRAGLTDMMNGLHRHMLEQELATAKADPNLGENQALERISALAGRRAGAAELAGGDARVAEVDHEGIVARAVAQALNPPEREWRIEESDGAGGR